MPRRRQEPVRAPYTNEKLNRDLRSRYGQKSLRRWAEKLSTESGVHVTHGTLHRALNDQAPRKLDLRRVLGFAPLLPVAEPCPHCGRVHQSDICPEQRPRNADGLSPVTVWARRVRAGAVVLGRSRRCKRRRCGVHFVGAAKQRYCSERCQVMAAASRRKRTKLVRLKKGR